MCGIAGFLRGSVEGESLRGMVCALHHRGPDDSGLWTDAEHGIGLAQARLAVLDVSPAGHQPMHSASGRFILVFNGEIYNHLRLREEISRLGVDVLYRGHADTETLLAGFEAWGIERTVTRAVGMFAFAVWDRETRSLTLGRDRLGEKPLYYSWMGETLLFGSELKALRAHPKFMAALDRDSLAGFLRFSYVPGPGSIYQGVHKLPPGSLVTVGHRCRSATPVRYWDARTAVAQGRRTPFSGTPVEAVDELDTLLRESVKGQMLSDVPLGAFLSGGVDSSTIVALMQAESSQRVKTFTIGFNEAEFNEAEHARLVAEHLGSDHTELYVTPAEAQNLIPRLPELYCEPFADVSQIPTFLLCQLARRSVTVALSGDAGDELFGGYNRYVLGERILRRVRLLPRPARILAARLIASVSPQMWTRLLSPILRRAGRLPSHSQIGDKLQKASTVLGARSAMDVYRMLVSHWHEPTAVVLGSREVVGPLDDATLRPATEDFVEEMMGLDLITYLPDDILVKVDRAAMAVSLETRVPLLDHRIVEFAWTLPLNLKIRERVTKWPLRQVLYRYVPRELIDRPKMGFGVPIDSWLRGPLRDWAESLLDASRLTREGVLAPQPIRRKWAEHLAGSRNWQYPLWNVLMFQAWQEHSRRS